MLKPLYFLGEADVQEETIPNSMIRGKSVRAERVLLSSRRASGF